jgi:hypothetical protein
VHDAAARLTLAPAEQAKLDRLLRRHLSIQARRSWRLGPAGFGRVAPELARFGWTGDGVAVRAGRRGAFLAVRSLAPLLFRVRKLRSARRGRRYGDGR